MQFLRQSFLGHKDITPVVGPRLGTHTTGLAATWAVKSIQMPRSGPTTQVVLWHSSCHSPLCYRHLPRGCAPWGQTRPWGRSGVLFLVYSVFLTGETLTQSFTCHVLMNAWGQAVVFTVGNSPAPRPHGARDRGQAVSQQAGVQKEGQSITDCSHMQ